MALIKSQLVLSDAMTGPLRSINKAMNLVLNSFESMQGAAGRPIDMASIDSARQELARLDRQLDELDNQTHKTDNTLNTLLRTLGLLAVARKAFDVLKTGVDYASDLAEVQNVVDVTFKGSASAINSWAKTTLDAYGMNEVSAKRYAGTIGAMLKSSGLAGDSIVGMSKDMVGLAGDMASFYNLDLETAFQKIRSGISGETEPLKQLGINMSVANLEAYALAQGIEKSYSEMSQAEQVMLRYNYLMSTTADAQGDFARTSDSWANQTRLLAESWLQFTGILAEQFLPMLTTVVTWLNGVVSFLTENAETVTTVLLAVGAAIGVVAAALLIWKLVTLAQAAAQWILNSALLANPLTWIVLLIAAVVAALVVWIRHVGGLTNAWNICKAALLVAWAAIKVAWYAVVYGIMWGVNKVLDFVDLLKLCWQKAGVAIANFMGDMKVSVLTILQNMINSAIDIINGFIGVLNKIPGVNIDLIEHVTFATTAAAENEAKKQARAEDLAAYEADIAAGKAKRAEDLAGHKANLDNAVEELATATNDLAELYNQSVEEAQAKSDAEEIATDSTVDAIGTDTSTIAGNTSGLKESSEDLKYLRDIAEQEAVNRFTTAEVKIDMTGMTNRIDSNMDLDGVLTTLTEGFAEALEIAAEGVHA